MSFNEKLQALRKEKKLSQEQLADMLDVTRQSVSKWESGTTYPEMDKLLMLCKIFKCSLDDLTNDEVSEIKLDSEKEKGSGFVNNILEIISKSVRMFSAMSFKQVVSCILALVGLALVILIFKIPFELLKDGLSSVVSTALSQGRLSNFLIVFISFILDIIYYVLYIMVYVYVYKIAFLDKYEFREVEKCVIPNSKEAVENRQVVKEVTIIKDSASENSFFKILGGIALGFIKCLILMFSLPAIFILGILFFFIVIDIYYIFDGIFFVGILLLLLFVALLVIWFLVLVSSFVFNKKLSFKKMLIMFLLGVVGVGVSGGIVALEIASFDYSDKVPIDAEVKIDHYEVSMKEELYFNFNHFYQDVVYVEDNSLDNVLVDIEYYEQLYKIDLENNKEVIELDMYFSNDFDRMKLFFRSVKKCLRDKVFYNFDDLISYKIIVRAKGENIQKIKENTKDFLKKEREEYESRQMEYYEDKIVSYEEELEKLRDKNIELEEKIGEMQEDCQNDFYERLD